MDAKFVLTAASMIWLNPLLVLAYLVGAGNIVDKYHRNFIADHPETNCTRLFPIPYLILAPILYVAVSVPAFTFLSTINSQLDWHEMFTPTIPWAAYLGHIISVLCLGVCFSKSGMEGNVMGFIFFPFFALSVAALFFGHISWLIHRVIL